MRNRFLIPTIRLAENDDIYSLIKLGHYYKDISKNYKEAARYFERARTLGDVYASLRLGEIYEKINTGVEDKKLIQEQLRTSLKRYQEVSDLESLNNEYTESIQNFFEELASSGDRTVIKYLADIYDSGKEYINALRWYKELVADNHPYGYFKYGEYLYNGYGIQRDYEKAYVKFVEAKELGEKKALYYLGNMLYLGQGSKQNHKEALVLLENANKAFSTFDPYYLAILLLNNKEIKSFTRVLRLLVKSATFGNKEAKKKLIELVLEKKVSKQYGELCLEYLKEFDLVDDTTSLTYAKLYEHDNEIFKSDLNKSIKYYILYIEKTGYTLENKELILHMLGIFIQLKLDIEFYYYINVLLKHYEFYLSDDKYLYDKYKQVEKKYS